MIGECKFCRSFHWERARRRYRALVWEEDSEPPQDVLNAGKYWVPVCANNPRAAAEWAVRASDFSLTPQRFRVIVEDVTDEGPIIRDTLIVQSEIRMAYYGSYDHES